MKQVISFILIIFLGSLLLQAQPSKVTSGVLALNQGDPETAIEKIELGIQDTSIFVKGKRKQLPKAYYNLSKAYYQIAVDTANASWDTQYPDALTRSAENWANFMRYEDKLRSPLEKDDLLTQYFLQDRIWAESFNRGISGFNTQEYDGAVDNFTNAITVKPSSLLNYRMRGFGYILLQDTAASLKDLDTFLAMYEDSYAEADEATMATPEFEQANEALNLVSQQAAIVYSFGDESSNQFYDVQKALDIIEVGLKYANKDDKEGQKYLERIELSIYQNNPELVEQAKAKFEAAIAKDPKDASLKIALGGMLEKAGDMDGAERYYLEAYELNNEGLEANFSLGAFYINKAAQLSGEKSGLTDEKLVEEFDEKILDLLTKAYPMMVKLHELQPNEREWLSQLVTITGNLGKDDEMETYGKKLGELSNN